jgi:hypothetical protein
MLKSLVSDVSEQTVYLRVGIRSEYVLGSVSGSNPDEVTANVAKLLRGAADELDQQRAALKVVNE